jgi:hypothetical protein
VTVGPEPSPTETQAALWKYNMRAVRVYQERLALRLRKQILWESETATDAEVRAMEAKLDPGDGGEQPPILGTTSGRAKHHAQLGADIVINYSGDETNASKTVAEIVETGGDAIAVKPHSYRLLAESNRCSRQRRIVRRDL